MTDKKTAKERAVEKLILRVADSNLQNRLLSALGDYTRENTRLLDKSAGVAVEFKDHDSVVLTDEIGNTYTSKSEELMDFLHKIPAFYLTSTGQQSKTEGK